MTRPIHLAVFGVPAPMGSKRAFGNGSRSWVVDAKPVALRDWQRLIAQAAQDWLTGWDRGEMTETSNGVHVHLTTREMLNEPVTVRAEFYLPRPKSVPMWRVWPDVKPDSSKLARAVEDPLTGILWRDDSQVVRLKVTKRYADTRPPGVDITITPLGAQLSPRARARLLSEEG